MVILIRVVTIAVMGAPFARPTTRKITPTTTQMHPTAVWTVLRGSLLFTAPSYYNGVRNPKAVPFLNLWPACYETEKSGKLCFELLQGTGGQGPHYGIRVILRDSLKPRSRSYIADGPQCINRIGSHNIPVTF